MDCQNISSEIAVVFVAPFHPELTVMCDFLNFFDQGSSKKNLSFSNHKSLADVASIDEKTYKKQNIMQHC